MRISLGLFLLTFVLFCEDTTGQLSKIIIQVDASQSSGKRKAIVNTWALNGPMINDIKSVVLEEDSLNRITYVNYINAPLGIQSKELFKTLGLVFLTEPDDSIIVKQEGQRLKFTGRGWEKYYIQYEYYLLRETKKWHRFRDAAKSIENYTEFSNQINHEYSFTTALIERYESNLSSYAYTYLKTLFAVEIESDRLRAFIGLNANRQELNIRSEDLVIIYDSTIAKSPVTNLIAADNDLYNLKLSIIPDLTRMQFRRIRNFIQSDTTDYSTFYYGCYKLAKQQYSGILREKVLARIVTSDLIKRAKFADETEIALTDFYTTATDTSLKNWVKEYELAWRKLTKGKIAPEFSIIDTKGDTVSLDDFSGKIVLLDFWFTGCAGCIQMVPALKKVEKYFSNNPNVVFLSVSIDKDKKTWLKSVAGSEYSSGRSINTYTNGQGQDHFIISRYKVTSYPTLFLIDHIGELATNKIPDPRIDNGQLLIELIKKQIAESHDGPYVLYKNGKIKTKVIKSTRSQAMNVDSAVYTMNQKPLLIVQTDDLDKTFTVELKKELNEEPALYAKPNKLLVLSDIEGNFDAFRKLLQANKIIDSNFNWTFNNGHLVLLGDFFDRGKQVTECLWLIYTLEEKAKLKGGYVHFILGNHEIFNLTNEQEYLNKKYKMNVVLINEDYKYLYDENSELGRWLRTKNVMEKIGDILFLHGGVSPEVNLLSLTVPEINSLVKPYYSKKANLSVPANDQAFKILVDSKTSPFWYRGYYKGAKDKQYTIDSTLKKFDVLHIVTGHTIVADTISLHYGGKIINIDTPHAKGKSESLLIEGNNYYRVNAAGEKKPILDFINRNSI